MAAGFILRSRHGTVFHFRRRVPKDLVERLGRTHIVVSLRSAVCGQARERARVLAQMAKLYSEELPAISMFFRTQPWVFPSALRGPKLVAPESNVSWNIYEWELQ